MSQPNFVQRLLTAPQAVIRYSQESYRELRKVSWPSRATTIQYTIIVAASSIAVGLIVGGIDFVLTIAFEKLIF